MQEERGSRGGGVDDDLRADWLSKRLAAACSGRQPANNRFRCAFTTVNGKFNQSYIEMVISCTCTCTRRDQAQVCACYITRAGAALPFPSVRRESEGWFLGSKVKDSSGGDYRGFKGPPRPRRRRACAGGRRFDSRREGEAASPDCSRGLWPETSPSICSHFNW